MIIDDESPLRRYVHVKTAASFLLTFGDKYIKHLYQMAVNLNKSVVEDDN